MMFWRSVVVKLWFTILLLVSVILFILSITILEFLQNYSTSENENDLTNTAEKIAKIVEYSYFQDWFGNCLGNH